MPSKIGAAVAKALSEANLDHDRIALGVSGGSDSLALLAGVIENRERSGRDVIVVHFDHLGEMLGCRPDRRGFH